MICKEFMHVMFRCKRLKDCTHTKYSDNVKSLNQTHYVSLVSWETWQTVEASVTLKR